MYCDAANSGPMRGGREEAGGLGGDMAVGIGGKLPGRGKGDGGGSGGGGRGWSGGIKGGGIKTKYPRS